MAAARRRCPHAIMLPPRFERYRAVSRVVMRTLGAFSPLVEPLSIDEAFVDMTGCEALSGEPRAMGESIRCAVFEATGLTVSVGVSTTKYVAKVASDRGKPDGLTVVAPDEVTRFLHSLPIDRLWGVGPRTRERLEARGHRHDRRGCRHPPRCARTLARHPRRPRARARAGTGREGGGPRAGGEVHRLREHSRYGRRRRSGDPAVAPPRGGHRGGQDAGRGAGRARRPGEAPGPPTSACTPGRPCWRPLPVRRGRSSKPPRRCSASSISAYRSASSGSPRSSFAKGARGRPSSSISSMPRARSTTNGLDRTLDAVRRRFGERALARARSLDRGPPPGT